MEKRSRLMWLNDFYGPLLTEKQRAALSMYLEEDLSLQEIAQETGISRQGVHETLTKAEEKLINYEQKLGLLERHLRLLKLAEQLKAQSPSPIIDEIIKELMQK